MRIEHIELRLVRLPLVAPFETSFGVETLEEHIIVRVDAEGVIGWGECATAPEPTFSCETTQTAWHILRDFLIPAILGRDLAGVDDAWARWARVRGHNLAKAGLEAALWDALAKARRVSLATLLGGTRERITVGVSVGIQPDPDRLVARVEGYLREGYRRVKIKIAPGRDLQFAAAVRRAFPNIMLQVDANAAYTLAEVATLRALDELNLLLIEQPLAHDDLYEHSLLQRELKTPLCLDESIGSAAAARAALALGSCRSVNIKPGRVGGFAESRQIHDECAARGAPVWCGGMLESGIGRAGNVALASLPNFVLPGDLSASKRYFAEDIVEPEFEIAADGTMAVPSAPGIGVAVRAERLERVTVQREEFGRVF